MHRLLQCLALSSLRSRRRQSSLLRCGAVACLYFCVACTARVVEPVSSSAQVSVQPATLAAESYPSLLAQEDHSSSESLYSLSVDRAPLVDVLHSLADQAGLHLDLRIKPESMISLQVHDRRLRDVLDAVTANCGCRYSLLDQHLLLQPDKAYLQSYPVDYLNIEREIEANLGIATRVGNLSISPSDQDSGGNISSTEVKSRAKLDLWQSLDSGLRSLLQIKADDNSVQVNSAAGLVVVYARQHKHREVANYLARLQSRALRQVSIEAQVIEIELNESHAAGVDWREIANNEGLSWLQTMSSGFSQAVQSGGAVLQYSASTGSSSTSVLVNLLEEYGDVRVISAPRVVALNNQPSVLSVVENKVYFSSSVERKSSDNESTVTESVATAIHTVPVGLVMQVTPQIAAGGDVVMSIRPTISRVSGYVNDPNPLLAAAGVVSRIPEIQVRELETVLRVQDRQTVVLGGMMQVGKSRDQQRVPLLHKVPALGALFRSRQKVSKQAELLVLLTPTVSTGGSQ